MLTESMNRDELFGRWRQWKTRIGGRRLVTPCTVEHEYQGKQWGHASTYAFVRFECTPAQELVFKMQGGGPHDLTADYCQRLHDAMSAAIVDVLIATDDPRTGCSLNCSEMKWDDVTSREHALYRATKAAMISLREQGWSPA